MGSAFLNKSLYAAVLSRGEVFAFCICSVSACRLWGLGFLSLRRLPLHQRRPKDLEVYLQQKTEEGSKRKQARNEGTDPFGSSFIV